MTVDIEALRALIEAATPGPWVTELMATSVHIHQKDGLHWLASCVVGNDYWHQPTASRGAKDATLIVAAVNALPDLLTEVAALREALKSAKDFLQTAPLESGICCCGNPVEGHGYGDGHSPVDDLRYAANQQIAAINAALGNPS